MKYLKKSFEIKENLVNLIINFIILCILIVYLLIKGEKSMVNKIYKVAQNILTMMYLLIQVIELGSISCEIN